MSGDINCTSHDRNKSEMFVRGAGGFSEATFRKMYERAARALCLERLLAKMALLNLYVRRAQLLEAEDRRVCLFVFLFV